MPYPPSRTDRRWVNALLLAATVATTTYTGAFHWIGFQADFRADFQTIDPQITLAALAGGLWYSLTILAILGAHEMGHYLACRYYGIAASLPYFLPVPFPLTGTAGAFIKIREPITTKRALFDIGIAGPLAGFAVAVPALVIGLALSRVVTLPPDFSGVSMGEPLLFRAVSWIVFGTPPDTASINMHPIGFAAWFGLLATALNLIPIGQFDGGHIAYATLGRHAHKVTLAAVAGAIGLSVYSSSWIVWTLLAVGLLFAFGWKHPAVWDETEPLDRTRRWMALAALVILVLCFTPAPIEPMDLLQPK
ncbi:MAG: site-2 protease family protein [Acidobacteriota bacterium]